MKTLLLIAAQLAASGSDAYFTDRNAHMRGFREHDSMAAPFVSNGRPERIAYFSVDAAVKIGFSAFIRRKHSTMGAAIALAGAADNGYGATYSATH